VSWTGAVERRAMTDQAAPDMTNLSINDNTNWEEQCKEKGYHSAEHLRFYATKNQENVDNNNMPRSFHDFYNWYSSRALDNESLKKAVSDITYQIEARSPRYIHQNYGPMSIWDVSKVTDMRGLFKERVHFNGDLSKWNVKNVRFMSNMFAGATSFNGDLSKWKVTNVIDMSHMFEGATSFRGDLTMWDVRNVTNASFMFSGPVKWGGAKVPKNIFKSYDVDAEDDADELYD
tara:strand:+ start:4430 stop:5125 length:696 start_codon:yes stop_codon:yes gene_type:complete